MIEITQCQPTNMAPTFSKFVYHKNCANLLLFQNFYQSNTRPYPYVLDSKEKSTWHVGVSTKEIDLADWHDHRIASLALFVEQTR